MKKIVVKVNINCQICKTDVLKAVTKLSGIDQLSVDGEKGTLTVIGEVDPVLIVERLRKIGKTAEITSVGPPKPPEPESPKQPPPPLPSCCSGCQYVAIGYYTYENGSLCSIL
ncbi:Heavy metal-associated isoprenylated plant protein [Melia azedarach]|uniref:Heavy metal-associated isoprenylated plant protein n=1 Tax=Melia azedarach TaxID=155640 RepID=A0ACC1YF47_MELAZ|nr:Heavy metal-associated isoprenylated plant protein [Melia azedarach]